MKESLERKKILVVCWQHLEPRKIDDLIEGPEKISLNKKYANKHNFREMINRMGEIKFNFS